jgi:hypothetical protein
MNDAKTPGDTLIAKTLTLKRPVDAGIVRQSFSHGRSKAVVVEKVRRGREILSGAPEEPSVAAVSPPPAAAAPTPRFESTPAPPQAPAQGIDKDVNEILKSIDELANRGNLTKRGMIDRHTAFAAWYAINFSDLDEDDALEAAAVDGGNDQGIDIAFADNTTQEILILQVHVPGSLPNFSKPTPLEKWNQAHQSVPFIKNPSLLSGAGRSDLMAKLESLKSKYPNYGMVVGLISLGLKSQQIVTTVDACNQTAERNYTFLYLAQEDVKLKYKFLVEEEGWIDEDELTFCGNYFADSGEYGQAYVGSVTAEELKRLHRTHKDKLFAGNVRLFLGRPKGSINAGIINTAKNSPGKFWALNNGITVVADNVTLSDGPEGATKLTLNRFSIVNGCQTTSSLDRANADKSAKVLARVIMANRGVKNEIVQFNNSQNPVNIWTVRAADGIQEPLRDEFRAAGLTYAPKQAGSRKKKSPNIVDLGKATQYMACRFKEYLITAINNKSELFEEPYHKLFNRGIRASDVYLAWLIGAFADSERQKLQEGLQRNDNAGLLWITSCYWIIYCSYKIIEKFNNLASPHITLEKVETPEFKSALANYVRCAADVFFFAASETFVHDQYQTHKRALRSADFLEKIDNRISVAIARLEAREKKLSKLEHVCKSAKLQ